jgi:hypothetical protein
VVRSKAAWLAMAAMPRAWLVIASLITDISAALDAKLWLRCAARAQ